MTEHDPLFTPVRPDFEAQREPILHKGARCPGQFVTRHAFDEAAHVLTRDVLQRDFITEILCISQAEHGLGDIPHLEIPPVQLFHFAFWNRERHGDVREAVPHQREAGFMGLNRCNLLALEARIHQQKLPGR